MANEEMNEKRIIGGTLLGSNNKCGLVEGSALQRASATCPTPIICHSSFIFLLECTVGAMCTQSCARSAKMRLSGWLAIR